MGLSITVPTEPLIRYIDHFLTGDDISKANALGLSIHTYRKYRYRKNMSWVTADKCAVNLGLHPSHIWGDWYLLTDKRNCA